MLSARWDWGSLTGQERRFTVPKCHPLCGHSRDPLTSPPAGSTVSCKTDAMRSQILLNFSKNTVP